MSQKFLLLNGPPRSGKDTLADLLLQRSLGLRIFKLSLTQPMRETIFALAGEPYSNERYEAIKDEVHPTLGVTIRKAMIDLSERHVKPTYGQDYWGRRVTAIAKMADPDSIIIIPDLGFVAEAMHICEFADPMNVAIVHLYRDEKDFSNDSRNYVHFGNKVLAYHNFENCQDALADVLTRDLRDLGWAI